MTDTPSARNCTDMRAAFKIKASRRCRRSSKVVGRSEYDAYARTARCALNLTLPQLPPLELLGRVCQTPLFDHPRVFQYQHEWQDRKNSRDT